MVTAISSVIFKMMSSLGRRLQPAVSGAAAVAAAALASGTEDVEAFVSEKLADGRSVDEARTDLQRKRGNVDGLVKVRQPFLAG